MITDERALNKIIAILDKESSDRDAILWAVREAMRAYAAQLLEDQKLNKLNKETVIARKAS